LEGARGNNGTPGSYVKMTLHMASMFISCLNEKRHLLITKRRFPKLCSVTFRDPEIVAESSVRKKSFDFVQHVTEDQTQLCLKIKSGIFFQPTVSNLIQ